MVKTTHVRKNQKKRTPLYNHSTNEYTGSVDKPRVLGIDEYIKAFPLGDEPTELSMETPHDLDKTIKFDELTHTYFVCFDPINSPGSFTSEGNMSVSGIVHKYFNEFDPIEAIHKMRNGRNWNKHNKYYGMTNKEISDGWKRNALEASSRGTWCHGQLEKCMNGFDLYSAPYSGLIQFQQFFKWKKNHFDGKLVPFRTELRFRSCKELKMTGTADLIAIDPNHPPPEDTQGVLTLHLKDWKFSKAIKETNRYQSGKGICQSLDDTNLSHYIIQQNLYKWFLEHIYNEWVWKGKQYTSVEVSTMELCVFHENHGTDGLVVPIPDMYELIDAIVEERRESIVNSLLL